MTRDNDRPSLSAPLSAYDHAQGSGGDAVVTLVEYGDYQCPHCGRAYPIVKEVQRQLGAQLRFVFRNFPLNQIHPNAQHAAEAAEAAGVQGRFWEMHDMLFENQHALLDGNLQDYATAIGLDRERFDSDLAGHVHAARVRKDFLSGVKSGVNGTPTFFINGLRYDESWDVRSLVSALESSVTA
jgi:protein-disulfide isomerase